MSGCQTCGHIGEAHNWSDGVCKEAGCYCMKFVEANGFDSIYNSMKPYLSSMTEVTDKIMYLLQNVKYLRNVSNKDFVLMYWMLVDGMEDRQVLELVKQLSKYKDKLTDSESIRRSRQKLVHDFPDLFGSFDPRFIDEKSYKMAAIEEWCTT